MSGEAVALPATRTPAYASTAAWRALAIVVSLAIALGWTFAQGKDVHWDAVNYHLYLGFSALHDRFAQDFFAAGPPAYLAPYAYVPLYLMSAAGWSAIAAATAIAAWHALALWLVFELAAAAGLRREDGRSPAWALLALLLAALNPVLLQGLGSTLSDISAGVPVLASWLALVYALRSGRTRVLVLAGILGGIAATLKLSNAFFAIGAATALFFLPGPLATRARGLLVYGAACAVAFAVSLAPWALRLWSEFGNPLFPFLNQVFHSADFTAEALHYERFIPHGLLHGALRPFEMLSVASHVHTEPRAPDVRYVALIAAGAAWAVAVRAGSREDANDAAREAGTEGALYGLVAALGTSWLIWLAMSGNSRYFVPMACVAGVVLALLLQRLHRRWPDVTALATALVLGVQGVQLAVGADLERSGLAWEGPWIRVDIPQRMRDEPSLYLSVGFLSGSAFLPYLHPQAGMINVGGFNVIAPGHAGFERASRMIERNAHRLRLLLPLPAGIVDRASLPGPPEQLDVYVRRLGLRVDGSDCEFPRLEGNLRGERRPESNSTWKYFISCRLVAAPAERLAYERRVAEVDAAFDRVEDACPALFHPRRPPTQEYGYLARTYHMGSEMQLFVEEGRVKYFFPLRGGDPIDIGTLAAWREAPQRIDCTRRTQPAFVRRGP